MTPPKECNAKGRHEGEAWSCDRPAVSNGLCDAHRKQMGRYGAVRPIRKVIGPAVQVTVRLTPDERERLGPNPTKTASAMVRAALAGKRRPRTPKA